MKGAELNLQVALDLLDLSKALSIAGEASRAGAHILEAGTPLIKSQGMKAVRALTKFGLPVNADLKTMDTGYLEVELAATNGAELASVLAAADDATIQGAVQAGKDYGIQVMADMINSFSLDQVRRLENLGVDYALIHVGIDQQAKGKTPLDALKEIPNLGVKLAVAGGLNKTNIPKLPPDVSIAIVGGAITKSNNPYLATKEILESMNRGSK